MSALTSQPSPADVAGLGDHRLTWTVGDCPNCGTVPCAHPDIPVCAEDLEDWPCAIVNAYHVGRTDERKALSAVAERFADGGVAKRIAGILFEAEPGEDCAFCRGQSGTCYRCQAEALVAAIRAEHLVVLTVEAAGEIVRQARKAAKR